MKLKQILAVVLVPAGLILLASGHGGGQVPPATTGTTLSVQAQTDLCNLGYCEPNSDGPIDGGYR